MAAIKGEIKRGILQAIWDAVEDDIAAQEMPSTVPDFQPIIVTLEDGLKAFHRMGFESIKSGRLSIGSSGLSHEVKWAAPAMWRGFSQEEVFSLAQELREVHADALITLSAQGIGSPTQTQIFNTMMADDRLQTVTSTYRDHTMIRWNQRF